MTKAAGVTASGDDDSAAAEATPDDEETLDIADSADGRCVAVEGRYATVRCVDGHRYQRRYETHHAATVALKFVAIFPSMWTKIG